jgi:hypothetical protein
LAMGRIRRRSCGGQIRLSSDDGLKGREHRYQSSPETCSRSNLLPMYPVWAIVIALAEGYVEAKSMAGDGEGARRRDGGLRGDGSRRGADSPAGVCPGRPARDPREGHGQGAWPPVMTRTLRFGVS